ncbi:hypothetical protein BZG36_00905 [Bifiguratus adelaidae]|uniref:PB1 domain-containing protein n=1 Tax=Bifiguratus adelaidae TaxID=1938954 RepID=A0A261Y5D8_9FUNG|nr:hypothetical protein BZG36_00905 [Bifiguratus adelaidae]
MSFKLELEQWGAACAAYEAKDFDGAVNQFIALGESAKMHFNIGLIFAELEDHNRALQAYGKAIRLDTFFAVAYFQQGVSYFVLGDMENAIKAFDEAHAASKMRGNTCINYNQLGLSFRLYACEVLFNRGICKLFINKIDAGLTDLYLAQKEKCTEEHEVIDQAVKDRGKGYSVYSIPEGVLFRPPQNKLKQAEYLTTKYLEHVNDPKNIAQEHKMSRINSVLLSIGLSDEGRKEGKRKGSGSSSTRSDDKKSGSLGVVGAIQANNMLDGERATPDSGSIGRAGGLAQGMGMKTPVPGGPGSLYPAGKSPYGPAASNPEAYNAWPERSMTPTQRPPFHPNRPPPQYMHGRGYPPEFRPHAGVNRTPTNHSNYPQPPYPPNLVYRPIPRPGGRGYGPPYGPPNMAGPPGARMPVYPPSPGHPDAYSPHMPPNGAPMPRPYPLPHPRPPPTTKPIGSYDSSSPSRSRIDSGFESHGTDSFSSTHMRPGLGLNDRLSNTSSSVGSARSSGRPEAGKEHANDESMPDEGIGHEDDDPEGHFGYYDDILAGTEDQDEEGGKLKIKLHYVDTRVLLVPSTVTFDELVHQVQEKFDAPQPLRLKYKDEDDEFVLMIEQDDLDMCRKVHLIKDGHQRGTPPPRVEKLEIWCTER